MKSCRRQAAHLQFLSKLTDFTASCCCCVEKKKILAPWAAWAQTSVVHSWWEKANYWLSTLLKQHKAMNLLSPQFVWQIHKLFFHCCLSDRVAAQGVFAAPSGLSSWKETHCRTFSKHPDWNQKVFQKCKIHLCVKFRWMCVATCCHPSSMLHQWGKTVSNCTIDYI